MFFVFLFVFVSTFDFEFPGNCNVRSKDASIGGFRMVDKTLVSKKDYNLITWHGFRLTEPNFSFHTTFSVTPKERNKSWYQRLYDGIFGSELRSNSAIYVCLSQKTPSLTNLDGLCVGVDFATKMMKVYSNEYVYREGESIVVNEAATGEEIADKAVKAFFGDNLTLDMAMSNNLLTVEFRGASRVSTITFEHHEFEFYGSFFSLVVETPEKEETYTIKRIEIY